MESLCRICLTREEPFLPIFIPESASSMNLYEKITFIGKIELAENDGLPSLICGRCASLVNMVHQFCELSQLSDLRLRQFYNKPLNTSLCVHTKACLDAFSQTDIHSTCEVGVQVTRTTSDFSAVQNIASISPDSTAANKLTCEYTTIFEDHKTTVQQTITEKHLHSEITNELSEKDTVRQTERQRKLKSPQHSCVNCKKTFTKIALSKHICAAEKAFFCTFCAQKFTRKSTMQRHAIHCMQKIDDPTPNNDRREHCGTDNEEIDCSAVKSPNSYSCQKCNVVFSNKHSLSKHLAKHNRKKFICCNCDATFYRPANLRRHQEKTLHKEYEEHERIPNEDATFVAGHGEKQQYKCETCDKLYLTRTALERHVAVHTDSELLKCEYCDKAFLRLDTLKVHTMRHEEAKYYYCDKCTKKYVTQYQLELHKKKHEKSKDREDENFHRFLCHICSKTCKSQASLSYHMSTHTGHKPYVCKVCGRGFTISSNLVNHERTHTGFKPFVCHYCSAQFATSSSFKCHLTTHTGEANYHCETCGKSFKRLKYLKEHKFTHTGEKPFACKVCGASYSHSGSLFAHTKKCKVQYPEMYASQNCPSHQENRININVDKPVGVFVV